MAFGCVVVGWNELIIAYVLLGSATGRDPWRTCEGGVVAITFLGRDRGGYLPS